MGRNRPRKSLATTRKPVRTTPTNPLFGVGKVFVPEVKGEFYVLGQSITKAEENYSKPQGPFGSIRLTQQCCFGDDKTIAWYDVSKNKWLLDGSEEGYLELIIFTGSEEVPQ
jgi:hypothetical protein